MQDFVEVDENSIGRGYPQQLDQLREFQMDTTGSSICNSVASRFPACQHQC